MRQVTLAEARAAKEKLAAVLKGLPELAGIGIAVLKSGGYGVKVNLSMLPPGLVIPPDVDGVSVIVEVVGEIEA